MPVVSVQPEAMDELAQLLNGQPEPRSLGSARAAGGKKRSTCTPPSAPAPKTPGAVTGGAVGLATDTPSTAPPVTARPRASAQTPQQFLQVLQRLEARKAELIMTQHGGASASQVPRQAREVGSDTRQAAEAGGQHSPSVANVMVGAHAREVQAQRRSLGKVTSAVQPRVVRSTNSRLQNGIST